MKHAQRARLKTINPGRKPIGPPGRARPLLCHSSPELHDS
jgi:hypothetical protein